MSQLRGLRETLNFYIGLSPEGALMNINIYTNYEVKITNNYSYLHEEGDFRDEKEQFTKTWDGGTLAEFSAFYFLYT
jgi:hypothetical protein